MGRAARQRNRLRSFEKSSNQDKYNQFSELMKWASARGFSSVGLRPRDFLGSGRGLQVITPISPGECLLSVPKCMLITTSVALQTELRSYITGSLLPTPLQLLIAFLLQERQKGHGSEWSAYLNTLPDEFSTPLFMKEMRFLDDNLLQRVTKMEEDVRKLYLGALRIFGSVVEDYDNFLWAWHVINTRSVYMKQPRSPDLSYEGGCVDHFALVPFFDMLNHSSSAKVQAQFNSLMERYELFTQDRYCKHDQVFICYGSHDNRTLLCEYGFSLDDNQNHFVPFDLVDIENAMKESLPDNCSDCVTASDCTVLSKGMCCDASGLSWNLLETIRRVASHRHLSSAGVNPLTKGVVSDWMRRCCRQLLMSALDSRLSYVSVIDECIVKSDCLHMIRQLYLSESRLLEAALDSLDGESIDEKADYTRENLNVSGIKRTRNHPSQKSSAGPNFLTEFLDDMI